jgi:galactose oxidase
LLIRSQAAQVFLLGGSWSGGLGGKGGELFTPAGSANGWTLLQGVSAEPILTKDPEGVYRADNHGWFFGWSGGSGASGDR